MTNKDKRIAKIESSQFKTERNNNKELNKLRNHLSLSDLGCAQALGFLEYEVAVAVRDENQESKLIYSKDIQNLKERLQNKVIQQEVNN